MVLVITRGDTFSVVHQPEKLGKTQEELEEMGVLLESEPIPEDRPGKEAILSFDGENLYYEYVDIVPSELEVLEAKLDTAILEITTLIYMGGMTP